MTAPLRIIVTGYSYAGKSPLIQLLMEALNLRGVRVQRIYGGGWIKALLPELRDKAEVELTREDKTVMTAEALKTLQAMPHYPARWMMGHVQPASQVVFFDGIRNPLDFAALWQPGTLVLMPTRTAGDDPEQRRGMEGLSDFERAGIPAIQATCVFLAATGAQSPGSLPLMLDLPVGARYSTAQIENVLNIILRAVGEPPWHT